jgi:hypothetical protein
MDIEREEHIEYSLGVYRDKLREHLPEKGNTTMMILKTGAIIHDVNAHIISRIYNLLKEK